MSFIYIMPLKDISKAHHKFMKKFTERVEAALKNYSNSEHIW
jgi:hypothetical protein